MADEPVRIGIIGGSGLYGMEGLERVREVQVETPFGAPSAALVIGEIAGTAVAFLPRHGRGHVLAPGEIPYRANVYALKTLGVERIVSVSACGSLRPAMAPGDVVVPDQLFDFTRGRRSSFFGAGWVAHVSVADPFCEALSAAVAAAIESAGGNVHRGGTFITIEGPRFSTRAESRVFQSWGMDIIGMTASPEAYLAREAGICYAAMAHVTDYDVWHESEEAVTVDVVIRRLNANLTLAQESIRRLIPHLAAQPPACACARALDGALITAPERIPDATRSNLRPLLGGDAQE